MTETADIQKQAAELRAQANSFLMATLTNQGEPDISYASFVEDNHKFYIFISELAAHTQNLLANGKISIMFIEDENNASNSFARKRLTYRCNVNPIHRENEVFSLVIEKMRSRFGSLIDTLVSLADFHLIELSPSGGHYVAGFGKAYEIDLDSGDFKLITGDKDS